MEKIEKLNRATGFILVITGLINFTESLYPEGFSWLIFGSMYLVMESYRSNQEGQSQKNMSTLFRKIFGWVGFVAAFVLLIYTIVQI